MIIRNEILEPNQVIFLKSPYTCTPYNRNHAGECVTLIAPLTTRIDTLADWLAQVQTWEVRLANGREILARLVHWLDKD